MNRFLGFIWMALLPCHFLALFAKGQDGKPSNGSQERPSDAFGKKAQLPTGVKVQRDIVYTKADGKELKLDIYWTETPETRPGIIFIHGGGWKSGDKHEFTWYCGMFAQNGYVVTSINYRLSGEASYPAQIEDCQNAVRWMRKNAAQYKLNPEKIAAVGPSAGGHLVSLLGVKDEKDCRVQAVVSIFGSHDLNSEQGESSTGIIKFMGGAKDQKPDLWKDACASTHITEDDPPFLLVHGDKDTTVPLSQSENFLKNLKAKGVEAELVVVKGAGHGFSGRDITPSLSEIDQKVLNFLAKHLK